MKQPLNCWDLLGFSRYWGCHQSMLDWGISDMSRRGWSRVLNPTDAGVGGKTVWLYRQLRKSPRLGQSEQLPGKQKRTGGAIRSP
jgi:hypothetical protein